MYKSIDELPITFGPAELSTILGISRNKAYELANRTDFPTYRIGKKSSSAKSISLHGWICSLVTQQVFPNGLVEIRVTVDWNDLEYDLSAA